MYDMQYEARCCSLHVHAACWPNSHVQVIRTYCTIRHKCIWFLHWQGHSKTFEAIFGCGASLSSPLFIYLVYLPPCWPASAPLLSHTLTNPIRHVTLRKLRRRPYATSLHSQTGNARKSFKLFRYRYLGKWSSLLSTLYGMKPIPFLIRRGLGSHSTPC